VRNTAAGLALAALAGAASADPVADILAEAQADCEGYNHGKFDAGDAVSRVDLTGDGGEDALIDAGRFTCTTSASFYCGSGGCTLHAVVGDRTWSYQAEAWRVIDWDGRPILLVARDGGWCGGVGAQQCFEAVVWSAGEPLTVMPE
jgi:hypothetical protein